MFNENIYTFYDDEGKKYTGTLRELCDIFDKNYSTVAHRLNKKMSIKDALMKRINYQEERYIVRKHSGTLPELCRIFNKNYSTVTARIKKQNMSVEEALTIPVRTIIRTYNEYTVVDENGKEYTDTLYKLCGIFEKKYHTVVCRIKSGMSVQEALTKQEHSSEIYTVKDQNGKEYTGTLRELCDVFGKNYGTVTDRINQQNMSVEEALLTSVDVEKRKDKARDGVKNRAKKYTVKDQNGKEYTGTLPELCGIFDKNYHAVRKKILEGISPQYALTKQIYNSKVHDVYTVKDQNGKEYTGNLKELCKIFDKNYGTVKTRMQRQRMNVEEALTIPTLRERKHKRKDKTIKMYKAINNIKKIREDTGITQQNIADALGVTTVNVSRIEKNDNLTTKTLCKIATVLGVHPNELVTYEEI